MKLPNIKKRVIIKNIIIGLALMGTGAFFAYKIIFGMLPVGMMGPKPDPYVLTQKVIKKDISPAKTFIGHVEALQSVDLKPKVTGEIKKVSFKEGSLVNADDILFTIEQDKYIAAKNLREADLAKAQAVLKQVKREFERQKSLNKQSFASQASLDLSESAYLQAQAAVQQAKASLDLANLDLEYTEVKSPITGYIGKAIITEGNIVTATNQTLARIVQMDPVRVSFSMSDKDFLGFKKAKLDNTLEKFKTEIVLPDGSIIYNNFISRFADNEVNSGTATVAVYADFGNENQLLIPGSYVKVVIKPSDKNEALIIPQMSILQDDIGNYVYTVNAEDIAEQKRVTLGDTIDENQVVLSGVDYNDNVIIQGLQKVKQGQKVKSTLVAREEGK